MKPLYQLIAQYRALEQLGTDEELDEQALHDSLEGLEGEIQIKATNIGAHVLNLEAYAEAAKDASQKLAERAGRIQRRADAMREFLRVQLRGAGIRKIEGPEFTLARKANPPAVLIADSAELSEQYLQPPDPTIGWIVTDVVDQGETYTDEDTGLECVCIGKTLLADIIESRFEPRAPDKKAIAAALKAGIEINGCSLDQGERLEIRA